MKVLLTLNKTFASYQIYWVFKEAEIQLKLHTTRRERERERERDVGFAYCSIKKI